MSEHGYKNLHIYMESHQLAIDIHAMTMGLPKFEMYEEGSQIRRSAKSTVSQIVEGYCLRQYKNDFILYLNRAFASNEETLEHLELLFQTKSLKDEIRYTLLKERLEILGKKIFRFIRKAHESHQKPSYLKEQDPEYELNPHHTSHITHPEDPQSPQIPHPENPQHRSPS